MHLSIFWAQPDIRVKSYGHLISCISDILIILLLFLLFLFNRGYDMNDQLDFILRGIKRADNNKVKLRLKSTHKSSFVRKKVT